MSYKIAFLHIPKTAGSTFIGILNDIYPENRRFRISGGSAVPANFQYEIAVEMYKRLDLRIFNKIDLLYGHMPFVQNDFKNQQFKFITFLREPISRVISDYYYILANPTNSIHLLVDGLNLVEYVSSNKDLHLDNLQTRLLSGKIKGELLNSDLELAKRNIENHFIFVGLTEYFNQSLALLKRKMDWLDYPLFSKKNVAKRGSKKVAKSEIELIENYNSFDIELYDFCKKKLELDITENQQFINLELQKFSKMSNDFERSKKFTLKVYLKRIYKFIK